MRLAAGTPAAWLLWCCCGGRLAAALRAERQAPATRAGLVVTSNATECGGSSRLIFNALPGEEEEEELEVLANDDSVLANDDSSPPLISLEGLDKPRYSRRHEDPLSLENKQWCEGGTTTLQSNSKVALVLTGQAFRAKDFFHKKSRDCTSRSLLAQTLLAKNHLDQLVNPLEAHGLSVDIFLSITPCSKETMKGRLEPWASDFDNERTLAELYGRERIKGHFRFNRSLSMYSRMADSFLRLDEVVRTERTYEYFIFLRYDVFLDNPFTSLIPEGSSIPHRGLSFFTRVHDFMFGFPGEMWNCFVTFWDHCMRTTKNKGITEISKEERRDLGCFELGPLRLKPWYQGYAYDYALREMEKASAFGSRWRGSTPRTTWYKTGTSGFDAEGVEHRCRSDWFWPPVSSWEHDFMPYFFHVGE